MSENKQTEMSLQQKIEAAQYLAFFPALTLLVFRKKVGYRVARPSWIISMTLLLLLLGELAPGVPGASRLDGTLMQLFAVAFLIAGMAHRFFRWRELVQGKFWLTYCTGVSHLERLPLPAWLTYFQRRERIAEPVAYWLLGFFIWLFLSRVLGAWVCLSAVAMAVFEQSRFERNLNADLDLLDGVVISEAIAETTAVFTPSATAAPGAGQAASRSLEQTQGVSTGLSDDIRAQIERKRNRRVLQKDDRTGDTAA
jgi:hypothetical protein